MTAGARHRFARPFGVLALLLPIAPIATSSASAQELQVARLGDFTLESGEVLFDCRIGYRTAGTLAADRSNVIVFPTWASGTSEQIMASHVGPGKLVDSSRYHVIVIDALANGVSSSPSNSQRQPRMRFPRITIRDMVATQHAVLTRVLGIDRVKAVVGVSMGGMQAFQWLVSYPDFVEAAIPIVGSPRLAPYDLIVWQAQIDALTRDADWKHGDYEENPGRVVQEAFGLLLLTTPDEFNRRTTREEAVPDLRKAAAMASTDANDKIRQAQAMMGLDVAQPFGGSLERAAAAVKARALVIAATRDHVVTPGPALEFARLLRARTLVLDGECGHMAPSCEFEAVARAVSDFLDR